jgi:pimeloyl-ACP methyl ester carboxylesterase
MRQAQNGPVILIGHSRGGLVLSHAAEDAPDAMDGLAYVCAMMLPGGSSRGMWKKHSQANPEFARAILPTPGGKGTVLDAELAPSILAQCSPPEAAKAMVLRAVSEPDSPRNAVLCLSDERYGCVPRSYIACTQDRSIPLSDQQAMIARQPGTRVYELEADHSPFLSAPQALAELLMTIAQERAG